MRINHRVSAEHLSEKAFSNTPAASIAAQINHAPLAQRVSLFKALSSQKAEKVFAFLEPVNQAQIIQKIERKTAIILLETMEPDDRVRVFEALPEKTAAQFLKRLSAKESRATALLLQYPEESAGRVMSPFFIALNPEMQVEEALAQIKQEGREAETIYVLPVVDEHKVLKGIVDLDALVMADLNQKVAELMDENIKSFSVYDDQEKVARFIQSTDYLAVPIVDEQHKLLGIVTIDDAMDIMQLEETEDFIRSSASGLLRKPYLSVSILHLVKIRVIWLALLALASSFTVKILGDFETTLDQVIALVLFIPLLIGIGGNTGAQSATTIVRALAVDDIRIGDFLLVLLRETGVGILLGISLGLGGYFIVSFLFQEQIALVVSLSILSICTIATFVGALMPILAHSLRLDPAIVSVPFVTTVLDASGLLIYFLIAQSVFKLN